MTKPVVKYIQLPEAPALEVGSRTVVKPIDHPVRSNFNPVYTSEIVSVGERYGDFETLNTQYTLASNG